MRLFLILIFLISCSSNSPEENKASVELEFIETPPTKESALTIQNIQHLIQVYDLSPILFTKKIQISPGKSQAWPVLIINSKNSTNTNQLLTQLIEAQMHWWLVQKNANLNLKKYLTHRCLQFYLGAKMAAKLIRPQSSWKNQIAVVKKNNLIPPGIP